MTKLTELDWDEKTMKSFADNYRVRMEALGGYLETLKKDDERYERRQVHLEGRVRDLEGIIEGMRIEAGLLGRMKLTL